MGKADTDVSFSSLLSITATLGSLKVAWRVWLWPKSRSKNTHTSSEGNLCAFAQLMSTNMEPNPHCKHKGLPCVFRWSLRQLVLLHFPSFVHYRSIFQCPPTHPLSSGRRRASLGFEHIISGEPTQLINCESYSRKE